MPVLQDIYNHYVETTHFIFDTEPVSLANPGSRNSTRLVPTGSSSRNKEAPRERRVPIRAKPFHAAKPHSSEMRRRAPSIRKTYTRGQARLKSTSHPIIVPQASVANSIRNSSRHLLTKLKSNGSCPASPRRMKPRLQFTAISDLRGSAPFRESRSS